MIKLSIPVKTVNEANGSHGHWAAKASRRKKQREATRLAWIALGGLKAWWTPLRVELTRVSPGLLDTDALPLSLKSIRDELADILGVTDGPTDDRVSWHYQQRKCKRGEFGVEVVIDSPETA